MDLKELNTFKTLHQIVKITDYVHEDGAEQKKNYATDRWWNAVARGILSVRDINPEEGD